MKPGFYKSFFDFKKKELHRVRFLFAIYILGFSYGTKNHVMDILSDGFLGYDYVSLPVNIYWTLLTLLDPLVILFLLLLPFPGMILSVLIMATDIAINSWVTVYFYYQTGIFSLDQLPFQIAFGIFLFITVPIAWRRIRSFVRKQC